MAVTARRVLLRLFALASALGLAYAPYVSGQHLWAAVGLMAFLCFGLAIYSSADADSKRRLAEKLFDAELDEYDADDEERDGSQAFALAQRFVIQVAVVTVGLGLAYFAWRQDLRLQAIVGLAGFLSFAFYVSSKVEVSRRRDELAIETPVSEDLATLESDGYTVLHDVHFGADDVVDHLVSGLNGVFLVESTSGKADARQIGIVKRQALRLQDELKCFVTPVICAGVRTKPSVQKDVLVAGRGRVAEAVRGHRGNLPVAAEQLARLRANSAPTPLRRAV
jgi:Nuclease-related domain